MQDPTDPLSAVGRQLLRLDANAYGELTPGGPGNPEARTILESIKPEDLVVGSFRNKSEARAMLAGLWLYFDYLDESHKVSQSLETPSGSFWHAIMHRREEDFSNSKYWYARCTEHPALQTLAAQAPGVVHALPADKSLLRMVINGWSAPAFVDLVQAVHDKPEDLRHKAAVELQRLEWRVLFDHCTRAAANS